MGAAISAADLGVMKRNSWIHDHPDGTATSAATPAPASGDGGGQPRSGAGSTERLTACERCAIEVRIARIRASLQDLADQVRRLHQGSGPFAPGAPGSPSS